MSEEINPPPAQRFELGQYPVIENDFPASARRGVVVVIAELIRKKHVGSCKALVREVERVARVLPRYGNIKVADEQRRLEELTLNMELARPTLSVGNDLRKAFGSCHRDGLGNP